MAGRVVVDASVAVQWFLDEPGSDASRALIDPAGPRRQLLCTCLLRLEVANALTSARRWRADDVASADGVLVELTTEVEFGSLDLRRATVLAELHGLTVYDAYHAAVAERLEATLATRDRTILAAGLGASPEAIVA